jgi:hypothetical protein
MCFFTPEMANRFEANSSQLKMTTGPIFFKPSLMTKNRLTKYNPPSSHILLATIGSKAVCHFRSKKTHTVVEIEVLISEKTTTDAVSSNVLGDGPSDSRHFKCT